MRQSSFVLVIFLSQVLSSPLQNQPTYPTILNLNNYKSISLQLKSDQDGEQAFMNEFLNMNNKRADLIMINSTHSFRTFNGDNYMILETKDVNEKTCQHIGEIDSYMFMNNLKIAWEKNLKGDLIYLGTQIVDDEDCHVWKYSDGNNEFEINTSIPKNENEQPKLKKIVRTKIHNKKKTIFIYDHIKFDFDYKIDEDKFKVPEDIKCE